MQDTFFMWLLGGVGTIFGAGIIALWTLQLRLETRLSNWIKAHIEEDMKNHADNDAAIKKTSEALTSSELEASRRFATKADIEKVFTEISNVRSHIDQGLNGVNSRLDLVLLNMRPGKE